MNPNDEALRETGVSSELIFDGKVVHLYLDNILLPDGKPATREYLRHVGAVAVLPLFADGTVACVRQYRYPFSRTLLEVPAGKLEPGEAPELAAARELSEETGLTAGRMQYLGANFTSPGYSEEVLHIYLARDLHRGAAHLDPGEFLNVERHPLEELVQMALDGELCDGKTTVALLKTQLLLARERGEAASGGL